MKHSHTQSCSALVMVVLALALPWEGAKGAGFEKATTWSGRFVGVGGAGVALVDGAEALYFNPAGLVAAERPEASLNLSPTWTRLKGKMPSLSATTQFSVVGNRKLSPVVGGLYSHPLGDRLSLGLGFYVSGGMKAFYEDVDYRPAAAWSTLRPTVKVDLAITELALGTAYEFAPGWRLGAAWRIVDVHADFSSAKMVTVNNVPVLQNVHFTDLQETKYDGLRVGLQYQAPDDKWGLGASWRSEVRFEAKGKTSGQFQAPVGGIQAMAPGTASIKNAFPQQIAVGCYYRETPALTLLAEYVWTQYSVNKVLDVTGTVGGRPLDVTGDITQNWKNQINYRFGLQYTGWDPWTLRLGYVNTSQVTASDHARATFSAPGWGHTLTVGAGRSFADKRLDVNLALEYSFASGRGANLPDGITEGSFSSNALAVHSGATYRF